MNTNVERKQKEEQEIKRIFLLNDVSATVILPAKMARKYGLEKGNHVIVKGTEEGILIKKATVSG